MRLHSWGSNTYGSLHGISLSAIGRAVDSIQLGSRCEERKLDAVGNVPLVHQQKVQ